MNIKEAEEVIKGLKADCDSGTLDWGYVDGADSVCHSWLVFNSSPQNTDKVVKLFGTSCFGLAYEAEEEVLSDYIDFMTGAISDRDSAVDEIVTIADNLLDDTDAKKQYDLAMVLFNSWNKSSILNELSGTDDFIKSLIENAAANGSQEALEFSKSQNW